MRLASFAAEPLGVAFKVAFRHASAERRAMQSLWVRARTVDGIEGIGEGCPREYVTGESLAGALAFVARHRDDWLQAIDGVDALRRWIGRERHAIDLEPAAFAAAELAMLDCAGRALGVPVERLLGLPEPGGRHRYTAVLGDGPEAAFAAQLERYRALGFAQFKIKLAGDAARDAAKARALRNAGIAPAAVRADANNLWSDGATAIAHLRALDYPFFALEEPLRAGDYAGMRKVGEACGARIILDESACRAAQLEALRPDPARWIVNVRVSKMGGLIRSLEVVGAARAIGLGVIVGAHVGETSVLTRAALAAGVAAGDALAGREGAFGTHLLECDPVQPSLVFGADGVLDLAQYPPLGPGFGLRLAAAEVRSA